MKRIVAIAVLAWSTACGGGRPPAPTATDPPSGRDAPGIAIVEVAGHDEHVEAADPPAAVEISGGVEVVEDEPPSEAAVDSAGVPADVSDVAPELAPGPDTSAETHGGDLEIARVASLRRRGRAAYERHCESCHDDGPRLLGRSFTAASVRRQVRRGSGRMRAIPPARLSNAELEAICVLLSSR